jgi:phosphatidylserine synthase
MLISWRSSSPKSSALSGVSRLARYDVTAEAPSVGAGQVAYFEGTPIPASKTLRIPKL